MITLDYCFNFGMAFGLMFADADECEEQELHWGVLLFLGPISLFLEKHLEQ
jgi:hypothetical protein